MIVGGIVAALLGAIVLAVGAQFQNRGVQRVNDGTEGRADSGFSPGQLLALARSGRWLLGSGLLTLAVLLQLVGLLLAPLVVVQPLGALSLVVTAVLGGPFNHARLPRAGLVGIAACVLGITVFVVTAAFTTRSSPDSDAQVVPVLVVLTVVLVVVLGGYLALRRRLPGLAFAVGGGVCFGFVATLMKVVLDRRRVAGEHHGTLFDATTWFTFLVLVSAGAAGSLGIYLVQTAYSSGSPDLVVAALTVIDPLVAVTIGIAVLGEAKGAPVWAGVVFVLTGVLAAAGVVQVARHPPKPDGDASPAGPGTDRTPEHRTA